MVMNMALSANWQGVAPAELGFDERRRREQAFAAARRHSRRVKRLRLMLPAAGALTVLAFTVVTRIGLPDNLDLAVARLSVTPNSIIMDNPHLTGFDGDRREYSVSADRAVQALARPDEVRLEAITARIVVTGQGTATITADAGDYDNSEGTLKLDGAIAVHSTEGYALRMNGADIDLQAGTMASANPVTVSYEDSQTIGESIAVTEGGQVIVLEGGVRTTLMPPKRDRQAKAAAQPAGK